MVPSNNIFSFNEAISKNSKACMDSDEELGGAIFDTGSSEEEEEQPERFQLIQNDVSTLQFKNYFAKILKKN